MLIFLQLESCKKMKFSITSTLMVPHHGSSKKSKSIWPRQKVIPIYVTLQKAEWHKVVGLSVNNEMERIRMKELYPIFKILSQHLPGGTEEYHEPAKYLVPQLRIKQGTFWYKLEALLLQLTCSFPLSYISWLQKYSTSKHQIYSMDTCMTCIYLNLYHYLSLLHRAHIHSSLRYSYISKPDFFQWPCTATMFRW